MHRRKAGWLLGTSQQDGGGTLAGLPEGSVSPAPAATGRGYRGHLLVACSSTPCPLGPTVLPVGVVTASF